MRRLASVLLAVAVAVIAAVAALDAVRADETPPTTPAERLRAAGVRGELVWSDGRCRRHSVVLPALARRDLRTVGCSVFTRRDSLDVVGGEIASFAYPDPGTTVVLPRAVLAREVGEAFRPVEAAWLGGLRYVAVFGGPSTVVALFEGDDAFFLTHSPDWTDVRVRASPGGSYFAVQAVGGGLDVHDREGGPLRLPRAGRAIAWSPDERFAAVAAGGAVSILPAEGGDEIARLPIAAQDVDWRK